MRGGPGQCAQDPQIAAARVAPAVIDWFCGPRGARGGLPWRPGPGVGRDGWAALVAEAMLQQTQVSRVVDRYPGFLAQFPTPAAMAGADEAAVLAAWSGLGYYRRARNLWRAARAIVERFEGRVPRSVAELRSLPGVGAYTAGAVASIAFGTEAAAVDGNVTRVLLRVAGADLAPGDKATERWAWARAEELARAAGAGAARVGALNEGLMDLGATVCVPAPAAPRCESCPLAELCVARREGSQGRIPRPKKRSSGDRVIFASAVVLSDAEGRVRMDQRADAGMWSGMWQPPTLERTDRASTAAEVSELARMKGGGGSLTLCGAFTHQTTHRRVEFQVWAAPAVACVRKSRGVRAAGEGAIVGAGAGTSWASAAELATLGISAAVRRVLAMGGLLGEIRARAAQADHPPAISSSASTPRRNASTRAR